MKQNGRRRRSRWTVMRNVNDTSERKSSAIVQAVPPADAISHSGCLYRNSDDRRRVTRDRWGVLYGVVIFPAGTDEFIGLPDDC